MMAHDEVENLISKLKQQPAYHEYQLMTHALMRRMAARIGELEKALEPFARAWEAATDKRPEVVARLSLAELAAIAKHHVSSPAFRTAARAVSDTGEKG